MAKPNPDQDLEARVAALESTVADLDERVTELEGTEPSPPSSDASLQELVNAGGEVGLLNAQYNEYCTISKTTQVVGAPSTVSAEGLEISNGKGIFVADADLELVDLTLCHARVPSLNGAGVRVSPDVAITLLDVEIYDCEMGVLTGGGDAVHSLENCFVHDNGTGGSGAMGHELYMWSREVWLQDSQVKCGNRSTHAIKTRSQKTTIQRCEIQGTSTSDQSFAGSVIDLCEGGDVLIEDTTIIVPQSMGHWLFLGYLTENANGGVGTVTLRDVVLKDERGRCGLWSRSGSGARLVLENCTYTGVEAPVLEGWDAVQGQFTKAR